MKNIGQMMKQAQQLQQKMAELQENLGHVEMTGAAGGGMVQVTVTGRGETRSVKIDPSLVVPSDVEVLEDLIVAAFNDAKAKSEEYAAAEMSKLTGGMGLPSSLKLPF